MQRTIPPRSADPVENFTRCQTPDETFGPTIQTHAEQHCTTGARLLPDANCDERCQGARGGYLSHALGEARPEGTSFRPVRFGSPCLTASRVTSERMSQRPSLFQIPVISQPRARRRGLSPPRTDRRESTTARSRQMSSPSPDTETRRRTSTYQNSAFRFRHICETCCHQPYLAHSVCHAAELTPTTAPPLQDATAYVRPHENARNGRAYRCQSALPVRIVRMSPEHFHTRLRFES